MAAGDINDPLSNIPGIALADNAVNPTDLGAGFALLKFKNGALVWLPHGGTVTTAMINPMTTQDDLIIGGAAGAPARLAKGTDGQVLSVDPTTHHLLWGAAGAPSQLLQIAETVVGVGGAPYIEFAAIPATYRHLELWWALRGDANAATVGLSLRFNGDAGNNYDTGRQYSNNVTVSGDIAVGATAMILFGVPALSAPANYAQFAKALIPYYAQTLFTKQLHTSQMQLGGTTAGSIYAGNYQHHWRATAAVDTIRLYPASGNFVQGSRASLYGVT